MISISINVTKIPKERLYKGEKGTYLNCQVAERKTPDNYGNTHSVYIYDKDTKEKIYIGEGKEIKWNEEPKKAEKSAWDGSGHTSHDDLPF